MEINNIDVTINKSVNVDTLIKCLNKVRYGEGVQEEYKAYVTLICEDAVAVIEYLREQVKLQHSKLVKQAEMLNRGNESTEMESEELPECFGKAGEYGGPIKCNLCDCQDECYEKMWRRENNDGCRKDEQGSRRNI